MKRAIGIGSLLIAGLLVCNTAAQRVTDKPVPKLLAPELHKVRWQSFDKKVCYALGDTKGRMWFMRKDPDDNHPQFICADVPGAQLILRVDGANRLWVISIGKLWHFDLNTRSKVVKETKGLFAADSSTGWPECLVGQVYLNHSSNRVYCHDYTGIHVLNKKQWTFRKWPACVLGTAGKVDLAAAEMQAVEAPGELAIFWSRANSLKGFWTHDGEIWKHYSSKTDPILSDITAIVPMLRGFVLVCGRSRNAFVVDLSSGASMATPETSVIINHLMRLDDKDLKVRAAAKKIVEAMARSDAKKISEAAEYISDDKLRKLAMSVIKNTPRDQGAHRKTPPGPKHPLRQASLIVRNAKGDALLTWIEGDGKKMGVLTAAGKIVEAPKTMGVEMHRRPDQSCLTTSDSSIVIVTDRLWKWDGRKFTPLCDESLECANVELLGADKSGRIFMEVEGSSNDYVRAMFDARYKGVEGTGVVNQPAEAPDIPLKTRD